jgi:putative lipase involved disintegration of autophagic bodies
MRGIIYTIKTGDSLYVGSTTNFTQRKYQHKKYIERVNYKGQKKLYDVIRQNGEWDMRIYKECDFNICYELRVEESKVIRELGADLNTNYITHFPKNPSAYESKILDKLTRERWENRNRV